MFQAAPAKSNRSSYRDVLRVSMPLVISMTTTVVMTFTDRVFLAHYSLDAIAAALPAGIAAFLFFTFFADTAGYTNVIIAQYVGAGALERVNLLRDDCLADHGRHLFWGRPAFSNGRACA
jgi:Na+-driven multidrug efflux pump